MFLTGRQIFPDGPAVVSPTMKLGDVANPQPPEWPRPLAGITVLAAEQMQALPYATQLLGRLGADIIKVEHPTSGDSGRGALPAMTDPEGRPVGATFLRNNLGKRSVGLDLKSARGSAVIEVPKTIAANITLRGGGATNPEYSAADYILDVNRVLVSKRAADPQMQITVEVSDRVTVQ